MAITFMHRRLPNGLTIIAEHDPSAHSAAAGFFVRTGARDERDEVMGVSHFLEHMMFKGADGLTAEDINRGFDEVGARNNAYTSSEVTCFHAHVLPEHLERASTLLARMMRPSLNQEDFDTEKGVILEEIAMYKDNPFWVLYEEAIARHYGPHPMSHRVLGTEQTIKALQRDQMRDYFRQRYSADNTVVALAGKLDFEREVEVVERLCGSWEATRPRRDTKRPSCGAGSFELRDEKVNRAYMIGIAPGPAAEEESRYAASLAAQVLGGSDNSRLHWALIEPGVAEEAQAAYDPHEGTGEFFVYASGEPTRAQEIWGEIGRQISSLAGSLTEDDLTRLRSKMATGVTVGGERPADRMMRLGRVWSALGIYRTLEEELDRVERVMLDDVRDVLARFPMTPATSGVLMPASG